jgi:hypothetical protein
MWRSITARKVASYWRRLRENRWTTAMFISIYLPTDFRSDSQRGDTDNQIDNRAKTNELLDNK